MPRRYHRRAVAARYGDNRKRTNKHIKRRTNVVDPQFYSSHSQQRAASGRIPAFAQAPMLSRGGRPIQHIAPRLHRYGGACAEVRQYRTATDINFFPNAQLGSDVAMLQQVRSGALDIMTASGIAMQVLTPVAGISGMAFAFPDYAKVWEALDGDLGAEIRAGLEKPGIYAFPKCLDSGYRNVTSSTRPINTVDDFKGMKIRVPPSPVWIRAAPGASLHRHYQQTLFRAPDRLLTGKKTR